MEELDKLKQIGAREIAKNTHMALNKIEDILDLNFGNLKDKTTTIGLIKILEREYNVSLQKWIKDYNEFWQSGVYQEEELSKTINIKITHEAIAPNNSMKIWLISVFILLIIGIGFYIYSNFIFSQEVKVENTLSENMEKDVVSADSTNNAPLDVSQTQDNSDDLSNSTLMEEEVPNKIEIKPLSNVWVGIIYLDNKQKVSLMTDKPLEIDITRPQTIITGHGMLEIDNNQKISQYNLAERMRFYVDEEGNFSVINNAEYKQYNGGIGW